MSYLKTGFFTKPRVVLGAFCLTLLIFAAGFENESLAETRYFEKVPDLPVMQGLKPLPEESTMFEKPAGRIVIQMAWANRIPPSQISGFYAQSLPALGWNRLEENLYRREGEILEIMFEPADQGRKVKFFLRPVSAR